ncbi:hypothetical protein F5888DRAFT_1612982, partial [Russula emetica]
LIATGNNSSAWGVDVVIRFVQLLRSCETRWSSTFSMVDRFIELYPVSTLFLKAIVAATHNVYSPLSTLYLSPQCPTTHPNRLSRRNMKSYIVSIRYLKYHFYCYGRI